MHSGGERDEDVGETFRRPDRVAQTHDRRVGAKKKKRAPTPFAQDMANNAADETVIEGASGGNEPASTIEDGRSALVRMNGNKKSRVSVGGAEETGGYKSVARHDVRKCGAHLVCDATQQRAEITPDRPRVVRRQGSREAKAELTRLLGDDIWRELSGNGEQRIADMRAIAEWEREPVAIYDSLLEEYGGGGRRVWAADLRQWQTFLRTHLRRLKHHELVQFLDERHTNLAGTFRQKFDEMCRNAGITSWNAGITHQMVGILTRLGETDPNVRRVMLAQRPDIVLPSHTTRRPSKPAPHLAFEAHFPGAYGRVVATRLVEHYKIDTVEALCGAPSPTLDAILSDLVGDVRSLEDKDTPVDGERDRVLRALYELGVELPRAYLMRYHGVYEWEVVRENAHATELLAWQPWLQPGRRISIRYRLRQKAPGLARRGSRLTPSEHKRHGYLQPRVLTQHGHIFLRLTGTVTEYREAMAEAPPTARHSLSSTARTTRSPPSEHEAPARTARAPVCTVLLDGNQLPWLSLPTELHQPKKTLTFAFGRTKRSRDEKVAAVVFQHSVHATPSDPCEPLVWEAALDEYERTTYLGPLAALYACDGLALEVPRSMNTALLAALPERGQHIAVERTAHIDGVALGATVEACVLRCHHKDNDKDGVKTLVDAADIYVEAWTDGHILKFVPASVSERDHKSCRPEVLVAQRIDSPNTGAAFTVCYQMPLVRSLRAQLERLKLALPRALDVQSLNDLVLQMLL
jgi:hypothetical protein